MIFNNKETFAIEVVFDETYERILFGKICYWINGVQYGDFNEATNLGDVLYCITTIIPHRLNRAGKAFCNCSPNEVFDLFHNAIYGDNINNLPDDVSKFEVSLRIDVLQHVHLYLFNCGEIDKLIYKINNQTEAKLLLLESGEFDAVLFRIYHYLQEQENVYHLFNY